MSGHPITDVVAAVIVRDGRILLTQRRSGKDYEWAWESPGGVVEPGESHEEAVRRELREELECEVGVVPVAPIWSGEFRNRIARHKHVRVSFYAVTLEPGWPDPSPCEGQGIGWFRPLEVGWLTLAPANRCAMEAIVKAVRDTTDGSPQETA